MSSWSRRRIKIEPGTPTRPGTRTAGRSTCPGGPPPPPPPSNTANLLVTVEGGGEVSSEPAGINCPGDCEQSFPVGTKVTLSPKAAPGSRFAGWHGACDGGGACAPAVSATTLVLVGLHSVRPAAAPVPRRPRRRRSQCCEGRLPILAPRPQAAPGRGARPSISSTAQTNWSPTSTMPWILRGRRRSASTD